MIRVRHVERTDRAEWIALREALWPEEPRAMREVEVDQFFAAPGQGGGAPLEAVLVAYEAGNGRSPLLGFVELSRREYAEGCETSPVGYLEGWYVVPEYRRRGIGRELLAAAESWVRARGCRELASDALAENSVSAMAHRALGFEEVEVIRCFRKDLSA